VKRHLTKLFFLEKIKLRQKFQESSSAKKITPQKLTFQEQRNFFLQVIDFVDFFPPVTTLFIRVSQFFFFLLSGREQVLRSTGSSSTIQK
jgi:hypothetical protein